METYKRALIDLVQDLLCALCKGLFRDPVTLHCGHNFCRGCIERVWAPENEPCHCPECGEELGTRKGVVNRSLAQMAEKVKKLNQTTPVVDKQPEVPGIEDRGVCDGDSESVRSFETRCSIATSMDHRVINFGDASGSELESLCNNKSDQPQGTDQSSGMEPAGDLTQTDRKTLQDSNPAWKSWNSIRLLETQDSNPDWKAESKDRVVNLFIFERPVASSSLLCAEGGGAVADSSTPETCAEQLPALSLCAVGNREGGMSVESIVVGSALQKIGDDLEKILFDGGAALEDFSKAERLPPENSSGSTQWEVEYQMILSGILKLLPGIASRVEF